MSGDASKPKHAGGRPRTGSLVWRKAGWSARYWTLTDGEWIRVCVPLGTDNKTVARRKLARLLETAGAPSSEETTRIETFEEAAGAIVKQQAEDGLKSWKDRVHRLKAWAFPAFGALPVNAIRPPHVQDALATCSKDGKSRRTVMHLLVDISTVLDELWRQEIIPENVARKVRVPKNAKVDGRERVILTDAEFARFMACPDVSAELHVMALTSRTLGGMRTSDLHAWDWAHVDTVQWLDAHIPRPKTKSGDRIALPPQLVPVLQAWRDSQGKPTSGPVFPVRRGPRAGERKRGKISYAEPLRDALWLAGIVRPLSGFVEAFGEWQQTLLEHRSEATVEAAESRARGLCLIQAGSVDLKPLDFHSFRRSYNTGLANAGVNVQTAMRLAGHRNASTHMRYVLIAETLETPAAALPNLVQAPVVPFALGRPPANPSDLLVGHRGLEPRANGLRERGAAPPSSSSSIIARHSSIGDGPQTDVMSGPCLNSVPFARAADAALVAYLGVMAQDLAACLLVRGESKEGGQPPLGT